MKAAKTQPHGPKTKTYWDKEVIDEIMKNYRLRNWKKQS